MVHDHFVAAAEVWRAYFSGRISAQARENALRPLRNALASYAPK